MTRRQILTAILVLVTVLCILAISLGFLLLTSGADSASVTVPVTREPEPTPVVTESPVLTPIPEPTRNPTPAPVRTGRIIAIPAPSREEAISYLTEVAIGPGTGDPAERLSKWTDGVIYIETGGEARPEDIAYLKSIMDEFNLLSTTSKLALKDKQGDIRIRFFPRTHFSVIDPSMDEYQNGFTRCSELNYVITAANAFVGSDLPEKERFQEIRRQLLASLGFKNTPWKYQESVFFGENLGTTVLSATDKDVIRWMYSDKVSPGMTISEVKQALA